MSKGLNRILDFMKLNDSEYDDDYDDEFDDPEEEEDPEPVKEKRTSSRSSSKEKKTRVSDPEDYDDIDDDVLPPSRRRSGSGSGSGSSRSYQGSRGNIVPMPSKSSTSQGMEVVVSKPRDFDDSEKISRLILDGSAVIINFGGVTSFEAQRIIDFVSGAVYAVGGSARLVADNIVIVSPSDVDLSGDFQDALNSNMDIPSFGMSAEGDL